MTVSILGIAIGLIVSGVTIGVFVAMGYYAVRIMRGLKGGVLSKGWVPITIAVFFLIAGQLLLDTSASRNIAQTTSGWLSFLGSLSETVAGLLIVVGFRAQYRAWYPKETTPEKTVEANKV